VVTLWPQGRSAYTSGAYLTLLGVCSVTTKTSGDDTIQPYQNNFCRRWTELASSIDCTSSDLSEQEQHVCNNAAYGGPVAGLTITAFVLIFAKLVLAMVHCAQSGGSRQVATLSILCSSLAGLFSFVSVVIYGSQCYFGEEARTFSCCDPGAFVTVTETRSTAGYGPAFFGILFAMLLMVGSSVASCVALSSKRDGAMLELRFDQPAAGQP
jgi:hypothetical protein